MTIYFNDDGERLERPEVRQVPQITAIDGVSTTFFGNFFGTSAAAPDAAAVAALALQANGGPGSVKPEDVYRKLQITATRVPLSSNRVFALSLSGPVFAAAQGDLPDLTNYWTIGVQPSASRTVSQVSIDLTAPGMRFSIPTGAFGFALGNVRGLSPQDVTVSRSADRTTLTLTFATQKFGKGDFITFKNFAFPVAFPFVSEVDADRIEGGKVTVKLDDGSMSTGTFFVTPKLPVNSFTGYGLVNADAATVPGDQRDDRKK